MSSEYMTGTGQKIRNVHPADACSGPFCVIHNPSDHPMREFPTHWLDARGLMQRVCPHGITHPDPDALALQPYAGLHECDGCCNLDVAVLPEPLCQGGYPLYQVEQFLDAKTFTAFKEWMSGQTMMLCRGRKYNHETKEYEEDCGGVSHGGVVYAWDLKRYLGVIAGRDVWD